MSDLFASLPSVLSGMGITPCDITLYQTACVHRSFLNESPKNIISHNERLEFLGDAALELAMTQIIYEAFPTKEEGWMTDLRSNYVRGSHLASIAINYHLDTIILISLGERNAGGAKNPNILADFFEAILGALFIDQGFEAVSQVVRVVVFSSDLVKTETKDAKSLLQEKIQQHIKITPHYTVLEEIGKDHEKVFTITVSIGEKSIGIGEGKNKKLAQESAAKNALECIQNWEFLLKN